MLLALWPNYWDDWQAQWRCTFDGDAKTITVNPAFNSISVKRDIYSAWKEWVSLRDHAKFEPALRTIGGDSVGGGLNAGDLYFLTNGWRVVVPHAVSFDGVLYNDEPSPVFDILAGGGANSTVSNLVQTATTTTNVYSTPPSAESIADAVWNSVERMRPEDISDEVWKDVRALTVAKFLGLK